MTLDFPTVEEKGNQNIFNTMVQTSVVYSKLSIPSSNNIAMQKRKTEYPLNRLAIPI